MTPKPHFGRSLGVIWAPLRLHFGALDPPGGPNGDPRGSKVHFSWILGALGVPPWGSLWDNFNDFFEFCCVKVGGWVADLLFKWFRGGKVTSAECLHVVKTY